MAGASSTVWAELSDPEPFGAEERSSGKVMPTTFVADTGEAKAIQVEPPFQITRKTEERILRGWAQGNPLYCAISALPALGSMLLLSAVPMATTLFDSGPYPLSPNWPAKVGMVGGAMTLYGMGALGWSHLGWEIRGKEKPAAKPGELPGLVRAWSLSLVRPAANVIDRARYSLKQLRNKRERNKRARSRQAGNKTHFWARLNLGTMRKLRGH